MPTAQIAPGSSSLCCSQVLELHHDGLEDCYLHGAVLVLLLWVFLQREARSRLPEPAVMFGSKQLRCAKGELSYLLLSCWWCALPSHANATQITLMV